MEGNKFSPRRPTLNSTLLAQEFVQEEERKSQNASTFFIYSTVREGSCKAIASPWSPQSYFCAQLFVPDSSLHSFLLLHSRSFHLQIHPCAPFYSLQVLPFNRKPNSETKRKRIRNNLLKCFKCHDFL